MHIVPIWHRSDCLGYCQGREELAVWLRFSGRSMIACCRTHLTWRTACPLSFKIEKEDRNPLGPRPLLLAKPIRVWVIVEIQLPTWIYPASFVLTGPECGPCSAQVQTVTVVCLWRAPQFDLEPTMGLFQCISA